MEPLGKLFGSNHIVKILRLFLFNPDHIFEHREMLRRTKVPEEIMRTERGMLERIGLIKKKYFYKEFKKRSRGHKRIVKRRVQGWALDPNFIYLKPLTNFFIETATVDETAFLQKIRKAGTPRAVFVSGFFVGDISAGNNTVDLLIVGDRINEKKLALAIRDIEAEMGKDINYAVFSTKDFKYRVEVRDRLVRDILDYPHKALVDRLEIT